MATDTPRTSWPVRRFRLGEEPEGDSLATTPEERLLLLERLSQEAWAASGRPVPDYDRRAAPGRVIRPVRQHR